VARYDEFNHAQDAFAILTLAGLNDVYLREGRPEIKTGVVSYELYTRSDLAPIALAALQTTQVSRILTSGDARIANSAWLALRANGVTATIRQLKLPDQGDIPSRLFSVYVRQADKEHAQELLASFTPHHL
jgi:hypothetical protein